MVVSILGYKLGLVSGRQRSRYALHVLQRRAVYGGHPWNYYGPSDRHQYFFFGKRRLVARRVLRGGYLLGCGARVYNNVHFPTFTRRRVPRPQLRRFRPKRAGYYPNQHQRTTQI